MIGSDSASQNQQKQNTLQRTQYTTVVISDDITTATNTDNITINNFFPIKEVKFTITYHISSDALDTWMLTTNMALPASNNMVATMGNLSARTLNGQTVPVAPDPPLPDYPYQNYYTGENVCQFHYIFREPAILNGSYQLNFSSLAGSAPTTCRYILSIEMLG